MANLNFLYIFVFFLTESQGINFSEIPQHASNETKTSGSVHVASIQYDYVQDPLLITAFLLAMCIVKILFEHCHRLKETIPESCVLMILGTLIGCLLLQKNAQSELTFLKFSRKAFFLYLLPPIVLDAAYSLKDRVFAANLGTIMLYAILGTILNVFIIGPFLYGFYLLGWMGTLSLTFLECLLFATVVAATDPVAVLAIFQDMGVNKLLYFLVFGEALFNDGICIVLYNTITDIMQIDSVGAKEMSLGVAAFACVCAGAVAIGTIIGFITAFITKYTSCAQSVEPLLIFGLAYLAYLLAELLDFSGFISLICCGLIQAHYAMENISSKSFISVKNFSKISSSVSEALIFIILAVMAVNVNKAWANFNIGFSVSALVLCLLARFFVTYGLALCVNRLLLGFRKIGRRDQFIMAYGGLRGPLTFSLAFSLDITLLSEKEKTQHVFLTAAYAVIFFTTFFQGVTMKPLVKLVQVRLHHQNEADVFGEINIAVLEYTCGAMAQIAGSRGGHYWSAMSKYLSRRFLRTVVNKSPHKKYTGVVSAYQKAIRSNSITPEAADTEVPHFSRRWSNLSEYFNNTNLPNVVSEAIIDNEESRREKMRQPRENNSAPQKLSTSTIHMEGGSSIDTERKTSASSEIGIHFKLDSYPGVSNQSVFSDRNRKVRTTEGMQNIAFDTEEYKNE